MADIFISYAREDQKYVRRLHGSLVDAGRDVWVDWSGPTPTANWVVEVGQAIEGAKAFVAVLSPDFASSQWCAIELEEAVRMGKRLIPVLHREVPASDIPECLRNIQWLSFPSVDAGSIQTLIEAVDTDIEWVTIHTSLLTRVMEWERSSRASGLLLRGDALKSAEELLAKYTGDQSPRPTTLQRDYVLASRRMATRVQRRAIAVLGGAVLLLVVASVFAILQMNRANTNEATALRQADISLSRSLASEASNMMATQPSSIQTALLLAVESMRREPSVEASSLISSVLPLLRRVSMSMDHREPAIFVGSGADGRRFVTAGRTNAIIWDADTGDQVAVLEHSGQINNVDMSGDGELFAVASGTMVTVWDVETGEEISHYTHDDQVLALDFSPDGSLIASSSGADHADSPDPGGTVTIWSVSTGRSIVRLVHDYAADSVLFSPNGNFVATTTLYGDVRLWTSDGTQLVQSIPEPVGTTEDDIDFFLSIAFSADSDLLAMGSFHGRVGLLNTDDGSQNVILHPGGIVGLLRFSPDGEYLVTADGGDYRSALHTGLVWHLSPRYPFIVESNPQLQGNVVAELAYEDTVDAVEFSPDGRYIAYGGGLHLHETSVRVWDNLTDIEVARLPHDSQVLDLAFAPDGSALVTGSEDGWARLWDLQAQPEQFFGSQSIEAQDGLARIRISDLAFAPRGTLLAAGGADGTANVWDIAEPAYFARFEGDTEIGFVGFTPDARLLVLGSDREVYVKDYEAGVEKAKLAINEPELITSMATDPSGKYVAVSTFVDYELTGAEAHVYIWDIDTARQVMKVPVTAGQPSSGGEFIPSGAASLGFSPDGALLAVTDWVDQSVRVFSVPDGDEVVVIHHRETIGATIGQAVRREEFDIDDLAFSPDSELVATAGKDGTARIWEVATGNELTRIGHEDWVASVEFSSDGLVLASAGGRVNSASRDNRVLLSDVMTGELLGAVTHEASVLGLSWSPSGNYLASYGEDLAVRISDEAGHLVQIVQYSESTPRFDQPAGGSARSTLLPVTGVSWSPDGKYVAIALPGLVRISLADPDDLISAFCRTATRNLSQSEWMRHLPSEPYEKTCPGL